jgi:hypothetical protein
MSQQNEQENEIANNGNNHDIVEESKHNHEDDIVIEDFNKKTERESKEEPSFNQKDGNLNLNGGNEESQNILYILTDEEKALSEINEEIDQLLKSATINGNIEIEWEKMKKYILYKLKFVLTHFSAPTKDNPSDTTIFTEICEQINKFSKAPFTLQRICELLLKPTFYKTRSKFLFSFNKLTNIEN